MKAGELDSTEDPMEREESSDKCMASTEKSKSKTSWKCLPLEIRQKILVTAMDDLKHTYRTCDYADLWLVEFLPRTRPQALLKKIVKDAQLASMEEMKHVVKEVLEWRQEEHLKAYRRLAQLRSEMCGDSMLDPNYICLLDRITGAMTVEAGLLVEIRDLADLEYRMGLPHAWEL